MDTPDSYPHPFPLEDLRMTLPTLVSTSAKPASGLRAVLSAAGSTASTVGALAAATQNQPKVSLGLALLAALLAFLGAFSRAPNTVRVE